MNIGQVKLVNIFLSAVAHGPSAARSTVCDLDLGPNIFRFAIRSQPRSMHFFQVPLCAMTVVNVPGQSSPFALFHFPIVCPFCCRFCSWWRDTVCVDSVHQGIVLDPIKFCGLSDDLARGKAKGSLFFSTINVSWIATEKCQILCCSKINIL